MIDLHYNYTNNLYKLYNNYDADCNESVSMTTCMYSHNAAHFCEDAELFVDNSYFV